MRPPIVPHTITNGWQLALHSPGPGTNYLIFAGEAATSSLSVTGRTLLLPGQWYELTVTHDGSEGRVYLDGVLLGQGAGGLALHDGPIYFGGGVGSYDSFSGRLDEIRVYTNCLTHEEISLTGNWHFDENGGAFIIDSGVKGHHGVVTDAMGWVSGRRGSGLELTTRRIEIANGQYTVLPGSGGSFSISLWLRPNALSVGRNGLMSCGDGTNNGWQVAIELDASGQHAVHFTSTNCGGTLDLAAPVPLTNGVWTKLDATYNGGIATIYADGRKVQTRSGAIRGSRAPLVVGAVPGLPNFDGVIDELKIYNRERDATEIGPVANTMWETVFINSTTNIHLQGFGPPGKALTYTVTSLISPTNGVLSNSGSPIVSYRAGGRKGPDAFAYTVSDGEFTSAPATVTLSVVRPHWLSPSRGMGGNRDGSTPEKAWPAGRVAALDAIWKTNNYYDCFFYAPGEYETRGTKYLERSTANRGCKHIGSGSSGSNRTTVKLVDNWGAWSEGIIFAASHYGIPSDGFELQHMLLDCNAENNPKYAQGEPVWIRIPLASTTRVETVTLKWRNGPLPGTALLLGRAIEFRWSARLSSGATSETNWTALTSTGQVDVAAIGAEADELVLQLDRRAAGVDFYSLAEIEVAGGTLSVPVASIPGGGPSRLNSQYSIVSAVDQNAATSWASGSEEIVEISLPLPPRTPVSQVALQWNCKTIANVGRFGPATQYAIRARDEQTGEYYDVPSVRRARTADGLEIATFGTDQFTNTLTTDGIMIVLTERDSAVDYYSLREVSLQNGRRLVAMRLPSAGSALNWGADYTALRAFDGGMETEWASGTQGSVTAIAVTAGSNMKFIDLRIVGFGTKALRECFPMYIRATGRGTAPARIGNVLIEDCIFAEPATNNADGLTTVVCLATAPDTLTNAIIRRCTISGMKPYFGYSHGFGANHVENCFVSDCTEAVYFEPELIADDVGPVLVRSNQFINVNNGVYLTSHAGTRFNSITCLNNEIVLTGSSGWGFAACDVCAPGPSASIRGLAALNNIIRYPDWQPRPLKQDGGLLYTNIRDAMFGNNVIALGTANALRVRHCPAGMIFPPPPTEDCDGVVFVPPGGITHPACLDPLPPGYQRAWFNNRELSGTLLDVRFMNRGVDGVASQQQWPE